MRAGVLAGLVAVIVAVPASAGPAGSCHVRTAAVDEDGIATIEAHCEWEVPAARLLAILRDPVQLGAALSTLLECRAVPGGRVEVHSVGWPIDDRQVTLDWREQPLPGGGARFRFARSARQEPLEAGRVAVSLEEGFWEIRPTADGGSRLDYSSRYASGGQLSPAITRRFLRSATAYSLAELRESAERLEASTRDVAAAPPH